MNYDENPIYTRNDEAKIHKNTFIISTETRQCKQMKNMKTYYKKNNLILLNLFVKQK